MAGAAEADTWLTRPAACSCGISLAQLASSSQLCVRQGVMAQSSQSVIEQRREQIFPKLDPDEIERLMRFGEVRSFAVGECLMTAGQVAPGLVVVFAGKIAWHSGPNSGDGVAPSGPYSLD